MKNNPAHSPVRGLFLSTSGAARVIYNPPLILVYFGRQLQKRFGVIAGGITILVCFLAISLQAAPVTKQQTGSTGNRFTYADLAMGTIVRLTLEHTSEQSADTAAKQAISTIHTLQQDFDHRSQQGSIGRVNEAAGRHPVIVSQKAGALLERALNFCRQSQGVFDISIGAITRIPGYFHEEADSRQKELVDYQQIAFDAVSRQVYLPREGMALDLGGLAKGTIIDAAVTVLRDQGIGSGIVEAGGDFFCFGDKTWRCGIQHPRKNELLGIIEVQNKAVCGSGDYYQFVITDADSMRKHHIIDISSGKSAQKSIGVTTVAETTELADALATTLMIMGPDDGRDFLRQYYPDAAAMWVLPDLRIVSTLNFPPLLPAE